MRKGKRIGRVPVEAKMRGIGGHHFEEGRLVGILKTEFEAKALLLQRRIILLNYLFETSTPEHREILPKYTVETMRRINEFLENS